MGRERVQEFHNQLIKLDERRCSRYEIVERDAREARRIWLHGWVSEMALHLVPAVEEFDSREQHRGFDLQRERIDLIFQVRRDDAAVVGPLSFWRRNGNLGQA